MTENEHTPDKALRADLLVLPGSTMMTLASAGDPLRAANRVVGRQVFAWRFVSLDGADVDTGSGIKWPVSARFDPDLDRDFLGIIASFRAKELADRTLTRAIYRAARRAAITAGIESGSWLMARAGLLDGRRATTHWEEFEDFAADCPQVDVRPDRYVIDGNCYSSSAAAPTFDMMIDYIRLRAGPVAANDVARAFSYEAGRAPDALQTQVAFGPDGAHDARLVRSVREMERRLEAPVSVDRIARQVGMTSRGLEKLFMREIGQTPGRYYLSLRLAAARRLLLDTRSGVAEVASRTGFSSGSTLSRAFRARYGQTPRQARGRAPDHSAATATGAGSTSRSGTSSSLGRRRVTMANIGGVK